ncbi:MAG: undecaprenyldiphospho-muramoylpentapeptide beta-N-acetylglucosaminyltransferase [Candidatus Schekmanbacteria bacterium]|nr:undecaprenyldiphospho-muramoylpentapeptide beta-N-acetylglucosaminyltransferase [Candidatus Schekmanbacteria bacterium]
MKILLAAGKTGGHIFPALSVAQEFLRRNPESEILLVGSPDEISSRIFAQYGIQWRGLEALPVKGAGFIGKLKAVKALLAAIKKAGEIIKQFEPQSVIGFGGYTSAAVIIVAKRKKIPCYLQEQNLLPGITNRWLGKLVKKVFISFADSEKYFPAGHTLWVGNPIRREIGTGKQDYGLFGLESGRFTLLVFGGSQGAHGINQLIIDAMILWPDKELQIIHQTGERDYIWAQKNYRQINLKACVQPFITQMPEAYACADLIICRAGATSIAELLQVGKAAILIPYPYAADDHQTLNARSLEKRGAAIFLPEKDLTAQRLIEEIKTLQTDKAKRGKMGQAAKDQAKPEAAAAIVDYLIQQNGGQLV